MAIPPSDALWNAVSGVAQLLLQEESMSTTLQRVVTLAVTLIDAVEEVGITAAHDDRPTTDAATGGVVYEIDNYQYDIDAGPCLHALLTGEVTEIAAMPADQRWSDYAAFAARRGINSSLSIPLALPIGSSKRAPVVRAGSIADAMRDGRVGAINLYSRREGPFTEDEREVAATFAQQAAVAIANARAYQAAHDLIQNIEAALGSRALIEQAKGVLVERERLDPDEAFDRLRQRSQAQNRKLRDVATDVVREAGADRA